MGIITSARPADDTFGQLVEVFTVGLCPAGEPGFKGSAMDTETKKIATSWGRTAEEAKFNAAAELAE